MRVLELFKGTGSIGKHCTKQGYDVVSLDIEGKYNANITADILHWDYKQYPVGYFDVVWASPPCTEYSHLLYGLPKRVRNLELADSIVKRTLDIIDYYKPKIWFIENPQTGLLKSRVFMQDLPFYDVSYCKYGFPYRKHTRIWTNMQGFEPLKCRQDCDMMEGKRHKSNLGRFDFKNVVTDKLTRYSIPQSLVKSLFDRIEL
jgi:hypothetical protein